MAGNFFAKKFHQKMCASQSLSPRIKNKLKSKKIKLIKKQKRRYRKKYFSDLLRIKQSEVLKMNRNVIIVVVLVVLVLLTAVQAVQLSSLKSSISSGKVSVGSAPSASSSGGSLPSSIENLPSMQGGC